MKVNQETGTIIRAGVPSILNPYDIFALEAAAYIKDMISETKIVVVTMGPQSAVDILRECLAIASDQAYLVSDAKFGGSDTLATAYILSSAVKEIERREGKFDVIFCGKQAIDGETAQVGPELAELLNYSLVSGAMDVVQAEEKYIKFLQEEEDVDRLVEVALPCLCTLSKWNKEIHPATIRNLLSAQNKKVKVLGLNDLKGIDMKRIGLKGSHTKVTKIFIPVKETHGVMIQEGSSQEKIRKLIKMLDDARLI